MFQLFGAKIIYLGGVAINGFCLISIPLSLKGLLLQ